MRAAASLPSSSSTTNMTSLSAFSSQSHAAAFSSYPSKVEAASSSEEEYSFPLPIKQVRFSKTSSFILVRDRTIGIKDKLWYSSEEVDYFKAEANFIVRDVRRKLSRRLCLHSGGSDDISSLLDSLEGYYSCDELFGLMNRISLECLARRQLLMTKVMEEHLWQRLRSRVSGGASSSNNYYCDAEMERQRLASISEEHSRWARQRARNAALQLQNEVSYGGKAWRRASQLCTDPERARASKVRRRVHRYQHKIACTAVKYGGNGEVGSDFVTPGAQP